MDALDRREMMLGVGVAALAKGILGPVTGLNPLVGSGAPDELVGKIGQVYFDVANGLLYGPKTVDGWPACLPQVGPPGIPGCSNNTYANLAAVAAAAVPSGTNQIQITGSSVGDSGAGMVLVYDASVDAAYVTANPMTSVRDAAGRGFKNITTNHVSIIAYGAKCDGSTDDTDAWQMALNTGKSVILPFGTSVINRSIKYTANGQVIFGEGPKCIIKQGAETAYLNSNGKSNIALSNLRVDGGSSSAFFQISSASLNALIERVYFYQGQQRIQLFSCDSVVVNNCYFMSTGYGVIQQYGYASNNVIVSNNTAEDMYSDFVEANCGILAPSKNWTISNNIFQGSHGYPTPATERRFVGITCVDNVVIANNIVKNSSGDAAIHLENSFGKVTITGNMFENCVPSGGNEGYIYALTSDVGKIIIANNTFLHSLDGVNASAYSQSSGAHSLQVTFLGNHIFGLGPIKNFSGCDVSFCTGHIIISENIFKFVDKAVIHVSSNNVVFSDNIVDSVNYGIFGNIGSTGSGGSNWLVNGNLFKAVMIKDIYTSVNSNGTNPPSSWTVINNVIEKGIIVTDLGAGGNNSTRNTTIKGNIIKSNATITGSIGGATNEIIVDNFRDGYKIGIYSEYADDAAAATGGVPVGGQYRTASTLKVRVS